ncbi:substrate-binding domain-containing protein [Caballeronia sp. GAFFF2]|uniref:substrate-binding domain-containing protein n=1 Tax=Caballeronia sp. GAFFF2 TaxID=2921741 RepID=UPI0020294006|nr:substrate-binding domain-containing protein [Caballeronia sp. GAFFF2]
MIHETRPLTLMSTLAVKGALTESVLPAFERHHGLTVNATFDPTNVLLERIVRGERASVMVAVTSAIDDLIAQRVLSPRGARAIVRTGIGVAVASDASVPPLRTVDELKRCLLAAKSVAYSRSGASGVYFATLLGRLGIAQQIDTNATVIPKGFTGECVTRGDADVAIQQLSELAMVSGVKIAGPLPEEVQSYTCFSIAAFAGADETPETEALLLALDSPAARDAYEKFGLECLD